MEPMELGRRDYVTAATAKVEIRRRRQFSVSSQVNGACSCSEERRQAMGEASMAYMRKWGKEGVTVMPQITGDAVQ